MPLDRERLEQDARHVLDVYEERDPAAARLARCVFAALADPAFFVPETHFIGQRPELFDKGVRQA